LGLQAPGQEPKNTEPKNTEPKNPIDVKFEAAKGVLTLGVNSNVSITFINNTQSRAKVDAATVAGNGLRARASGGEALPAMEVKLDEPAFEIPPRGSLTVSLDAAPIVAAIAGKTDLVELWYDGAALKSAPATFELVEDLRKTVVTFKTNKGVLKFMVDPVHAPLASRNFVRHAKMGTYTGTQFHRVIKGFMAQGGDPNSKDANPADDGMGGAPFNKRPLVAEFSDVKHVRGVLSMARGGDPTFGQVQSMLVQGILSRQPNPNDPAVLKSVSDQIGQLVSTGILKERAQFTNTAGSQFFLCFTDAPNLDGSYTAFGKMIDGDPTLTAFEAAASDGKSQNTRPTEPLIVQEVEVSEGK
jgi:cyclophilin family peptidyl-prolyl cis-trans isomerase